MTGLYSEYVDMNHCSSTGFRQLSSFSILNSMLNTNSDTLRRVVQADLNLQPRSSACWTAQLLSAFQGLRGCESYVLAVQTGRAIPMQEFTADLILGMSCDVHQPSNRYLFFVNSISPMKLLPLQLSVKAEL